MGWFKKVKDVVVAEPEVEVSADASTEETPYACYVQLYPVYDASDIETVTTVRVDISTVNFNYDIPGFSYTVNVSPAMSPEFVEFAADEARVTTNSATLMPINETLQDADTVSGELKTCLHEVAVAGLLVLFRASVAEELRQAKEEAARIAAHEDAIRAKYNLR